MYFIDYLKEKYYNLLSERYSIDASKKNYEIIEDIGRLRQCIQKGGEVDIDKTSNIILEDFRSGKLGRISLEMP